MTRRTPTLLLAAALLAVSATLPGCTALNSLLKLTGLRSAPEFTLPEPPAPLPPDFRLTVLVRDQAAPPLDYLLEFHRTGNVDYRVTVREPRRAEREGSFQVLENQVESLWDALLEVRFDELEDRYPDDGRGDDPDAGHQEVWVFANGLDRRVEADFERVEALEKVRRAALAVVPEHVLSARLDAAPGEAPEHFVGDPATKRFHLPGCPALEGTPEPGRQPFGTKYDAVNFGFSPCPDCRPLDSREKR